ncbi:MAG: SDR family NAD(P)-dependent oxidoreductase [bacterium]
MNMSNMPVLVTGACGFIGSHLTEALVKQGAKTRALTFYDARGASGWLSDLPPDIRKSIELISGDVRDTEQMSRIVQEGDTVFHLAALIGIPYSYMAPRSYVETNITGTLNILEACRQKHASRLLVTSTSEVYGSALSVPISESHPLQAQSPYSATKIAAEKLAESYIRSFNLPATIVRPFNTFGPRQSARAVIPTLLMQLTAASGEVCLGDISTTRDFNYVADTVDAFLQIAACDRAVGQTVNIGTGLEISIAQLVETARRISGRQVRIKFDEQRVRPSTSEVKRLCADATLLKALTGWTPSFGLEKGLRLTWDWLMTKGGASYDPQRYYF